MNRFATSDEHLGHENILTGWGGKQTPRPFVTMDDMVEGIIDRHNSVVKDGDEVYHLGDMFWRSFGEPRAAWVTGRLNGHHFYVLGNHDELFFYDNGRPSYLYDQFVSVSQRLFLKDKLNRHGIVLDHYAGRVWNGSHKGSYQFFGHSHGNLNQFQGDFLSYDVGVDSNDFTPVAFEDIAAKLRKVAERRDFRIQNAPRLVRDYYSVTT